MRRIFLILMIVLLPLRGIAGDAMAAQMLPSMLGQSAVTAVAMPCHGDAAQAVQTDDGLGLQSACSACQACHLSVFVSYTLFATPVAKAGAQPASPVVQWASAELALIAKPPVF